MGFAVFGNHGVTHWDKERAQDGVTLYTTIGSGVTRLIDMDGNTRCMSGRRPRRPSPSTAF